jgi:hypothetical protein
MDLARPRSADHGARAGSLAGDLAPDTSAINTYVVVDVPVTWRPRLAGRTCGVISAAGSALATIGAVINVVQGDLVLLVGLFLFPVCGLLSWQLSIGSSLTLTSTEVIVRNPFGVSRILLREIADVNAGYGGVAIWRVDRTGVSAWAVQKTVIATWFRLHTRADDIVEAIRAAARASGAPPPPQQLVRPVPARESLGQEFHRYQRGFHPRHGNH